MTTSLSRASNPRVAEGAGDVTPPAPEHRSDGCFSNAALLASRAFDLSLGRSALSAPDEACNLDERTRP